MIESAIQAVLIGLDGQILSCEPWIGAFDESDSPDQLRRRSREQSLSISSKKALPAGENALGIVFLNPDTILLGKGRIDDTGSWHLTSPMIWLP